MFFQTKKKKENLGGLINKTAKDKASQRTEGRFNGNLKKKMCMCMCVSVSFEKGYLNGKVRYSCVNIFAFRFF